MSGIGLTKYEEEVIIVKYKSKRFSKISQVELPVIFKTLLFRIHTITGWKLPDDDIFLKILIDELGKFISEKYNDMNPDEVTFAFRNYGTEIKDWGKSINLSLIDEPISKYLEHRKCLSEIEERKKVNDELKNLPMQSDWKEVCEHYYQNFLVEKVNIKLWPVQMYDELKEAVYISYDAFEDFISKAKNYLIANAKIELTEAIKKENKNLQENLNNEIILFETNINNTKNKVEDYAKRFAILYLFAEAKKLGFKNLFINILKSRDE